jgi:hypothetical protein
MINVIELKATASKNPHLDEKEVEAMFTFFYQIHDHTASRPAVPVWWERAKYSSDITKMN